ncbi:MAG: HD domain-containing protein, partial [Candidatus Methanofastidiosia archaeon]
MEQDGLFDSLEESEKGKLRRIKDHINEIFKKDTVFHPCCTLHGIEHSEAVIKKLEGLTRNLMKSSHKLNHCEIFCLLAAAYLHDTGMLVENPDDEERVTNMQINGQVSSTYQVSDLIREEHHERSEQYINKNQKELGLDLETEIIGKISKGHRKENLNTDYYDDDVLGEPIRVRLLAALLRLADELDADFRRAPKHLKKLLEKRMDPLNTLHWVKHYCTKGIKIDGKTESGLQIITIKPHLIVPNKGYGEKYIVPLVVEPIKQKLDPSSGADYIGEILSSYGIKVELEEPRVDIKPTLDVAPPEVFEEAKKHQRKKKKLMDAPGYPTLEIDMRKDTPSLVQIPTITEFPLQQFGVQSGIYGIHGEMGKLSFLSQFGVQPSVSIFFISENKVISPEANKMKVYFSKEDVQFEFKKKNIKTFNIIKNRQFKKTLQNLEEKNLIVLKGLEDSGKTSFAYVLCEELLKKNWGIVFYQENAVLEKEDIKDNVPVVIVIDGMEELNFEEQEAAYRLYKTLCNDCAFLVTYRTEEADRICRKWKREINDTEYKYMIRFEADEFEKIIKVHADERGIKISEKTSEQFAQRVSDFSGSPSHVVYSFMAKEKGTTFKSNDIRKIPFELNKIRNKVIKSVSKETKALLKAFRFYFLVADERSNFLSTKLIKVAFSYYIPEFIQTEFDEAVDQLTDLGLIREIAPEMVTFPKEGFLKAVDLGLNDTDFDDIKKIVKQGFLESFIDIRVEDFDEETYSQKIAIEFLLSRELGVPIVDFGSAILAKDRNKGTKALLNIARNVSKDLRDDICDLIVDTLEPLEAKNIDDWHLLGISYGRMEDYPKAQECFQKVVDLDPENIGGWIGLGVIASNLEDYPKAQE